MNSLKCPKSKSLSHCLTELFPIYQNKHWTIRWQKDHSVNPWSHRIILKIVGFLIGIRLINLPKNGKGTSHLVPIYSDGPGGKEGGAVSPLFVS